MYNKVTLIGRLGKDPELTDVGSTKKCSFSIATSEHWNDKDGQKQEKTVWHNIVSWGKSAESCSQYLAKGSLVLVDGKIDSYQYEKDGEKKTFYSIKSDRVKFLDKKSEGSVSTLSGVPNSADNIPF